MQTQGDTKFRVDDALSAWTEELAGLIPYPAMQFDQRSSYSYTSTSTSRRTGKSSTPASRLYWNVLTSGYVCMDVFTPNVKEIKSGCIVYVRLDNAGKASYESPQLHVYGDDRREVLEHLDLAIAELPEGFRMGTVDDPLQLNPNGIDYRQLIEFGRLLHELRTGRPM